MWSRNFFARAARAAFRNPLLEILPTTLGVPFKHGFDLLFSYKYEAMKLHVWLMLVQSTSLPLHINL